MTLDRFRLLLPAGQLRYVLEHGTYLAQRHEDDGSLNLYHLPDAGRGYFIEVGAVASKLVVLRSFWRAAPLEDYAHEVKLPQE